MSTSRRYGDDAYWIERFSEKPRADEDITDEWLLSWVQLQPLLDLPPNATVLDLGCGNSELAFNLLRDVSDARVIAIDIAPGAIRYQREQQRAAISRGSESASRATFLVLNAAVAGVRLADAVSCSIDKSTTDGLLCDTKGGAARVRTMYANVGRSLAPAAAALVVVCSWRDPESDGLEWLTDLILGGLRSGDAGAEASWSLDVHTIVSPSGDARGPHVYLLRRRPLRRSPRAKKRGRADDCGEEELRMRLHLHEAT